MSHINFRTILHTDRVRMMARDREAFRKLEDAEHRGGAVWFRAAHFGGILAHLPTQKPTGSGQMIKL